jgi:hypothetical protein
VCYLSKWETSKFSEPAYFETAFLNPQKEMTAKWIRHPEKDEEPVKDDNKKNGNGKEFLPCCGKHLK